MQNDPLFLQTKAKIESWRKSKKHPREPLPEDIKKDLSDLAQFYPIHKLGSAFKLGECSLKYLKSKIKKNQKIKKNVAEFVELSSIVSNKVADDQKKIELDLPMGITLRIFL